MKDGYRSHSGILHGDPDTKIHTAAITEGGIRLASELADGFSRYG